MTQAAKRALFWCLTLTLPLAALACTELLFRATGLFAPEPLFLDVAESQGTYFKFNPWVTRRYFDSTSAALPNLAPELFSRVKPASTFRILCIGESTTAGFPFESQVPFPVQLREILAHAYPGRRFEVLNAGISAISSYVTLDLLDELLRETDPDVVVAYLGHNEFYGVYGSGSTLSPGGKRILVTTMLRLQHLHLAQMVKHALGALRSRPASATEDRTLMQNVIGDQDIALGSLQYRNTLEAFQDNLTAIADLCRGRGVPIVISNLVSNVCDQPPFHSLTHPSGLASVGNVVGAALRAGDSLLATGQPAGAEARYLEAWRADTSNADVWFGIGRAKLAQRDSGGALEWLVGAKDRDAMRFRASEDFSSIIAGVAEKRGMKFVDMTGTFRHASPGGIIGRDLMCDHLHPNPQGYYLMATAFYRGVVSVGVLPAPDPAFVPPRAPYGVTDLDWEIGLLKIFPMIHEWPFKQVRITRGDYHSYGDTAATRIAMEYIRSGFAWVRAHDRMGHVYGERGDLERARREYIAIAVCQPDDSWPYEQIARLYGAEENWPLRSVALLEAFLRSPLKGNIAYQLALSEEKQGHPDKAIRAMQLASAAPELKREERENARFYLAGLLSDSGRRDEAIRILRDILAENPEFVPARKFFSRLERNAP
jgi:tetratricopeptide (TPR) repeat protein